MLCCAVPHPQVQLQVVAMDDIFTLAALSEYDLFTMARSVYANKKVGVGTIMNVRLVCAV